MGEFRDDEGEVNDNLLSLHRDQKILKAAQVSPYHAHLPPVSFGQPLIGSALQVKTGHFVSFGQKRLYRAAADVAEGSSQ